MKFLILLHFKDTKNPTCSASTLLVLTPDITVPRASVLLARMIPSFPSGATTVALDRSVRAAARRALAEMCRRPCAEADAAASGARRGTRARRSSRGR